MFGIRKLQSLGYRVALIARPSVQLCEHYQRVTDRRAELGIRDKNYTKQLQ